MIRKDYDLIGETVYYEKLPNGLSVFVIPKRGFNKYFAYFASNYGGADSRYKLAGNWVDSPYGVAHFLEHKMFDTAEGDAMAKLSSNGASSNAYTSADITAYFFDCVDRFPENLETLISFVSVPYFTPESVDKEQGIIGQEILMCLDDPDHNLYYGLMESLFGPHPLSRSVAGTLESIATITAGTLYDCHKAFYAPANMSLCVAGDVDPETITSAARRMLPEGPGEIPLRDYGLNESLQPAAARFTKEMDVSLPIFLAGCKIPFAGHGEASLTFDLTGALALDVLAGNSSPLYCRMYADGLISGDFSASIDSAADSAYFMFGGETREPERVFDEMAKELHRLSREGVDPKLFERIKKAAAGSHIRMLNSFDAICAGIAGGAFRGYDSLKAMELLSKITEDDVTAFLSENIDCGNMAMSIISPKS